MEISLGLPPCTLGTVTPGMPVRLIQHEVLLGLLTFLSSDFSLFFLSVSFYQVLARAHLCFLFLRSYLPFRVAALLNLHA